MPLVTARLETRAGRIATNMRAWNPCCNSYARCDNAWPICGSCGGSRQACHNPAEYTPGPDAITLADPVQSHETPRPLLGDVDAKSGAAPRYHWDPGFTRSMEAQDRQHIMDYTASQRASPGDLEADNTRSHWRPFSGYIVQFSKSRMLADKSVFSSKAKSGSRAQPRRQRSRCEAIQVVCLAATRR